MFKNLKIATKLLLFGIIVMSLPLLTVGISSVSIAAKGLTSSAEEQMTSRASELALLVDFVIEEELKIAKHLSVLDVTVKASEAYYHEESNERTNMIAALNKTFSDFKKTEGLGENYQVVIAADTAGIVFAASEEKFLGVSLSDRGYIKDALKGNANIGAVGLNKVTNEPFLPIAMPVYSPEGKLVAVFSSIIDISFLNHLVGDSKIGKTGYTFITDSKGLVIAHPDPEIIMKLNMTEAEGMKNIASNMISGKSGVEKYVYQGIDKSCGYAPVKTTGWSVALTLPDSEFLAPVYMVRNIVAVVGIIFLIIGIMISLLFARNISSLLREAVVFATKIASGDLKTSIAINQKDEIGQLANSLNDMKKKLNRILQDIKSASSEVSSGSQQISSTSQQISSGASEQAASTEEVSSSMEELVSNIQQNTENAQMADNIVKKVAVEASQGGESVNETVLAMKSIADKISIIEDIARNTNMLALNAAIEAARAGDAGKGFAVVAAEVRKLAENSRNAAAEIIDISINSVQAAEKAGILINDLVPQIQKTADLVQEIAISSQEQNRGAEQVNAALQQLDTVIQQNASASEEMASMSEELNSQAELMQENVGFFQLEESTERINSHDKKSNPVKTKTGKIKSDTGSDFNETNGFKEF